MGQKSRAAENFGIYIRDKKKEDEEKSNKIHKEHIRHTPRDELCCRRHPKQAGVRWVTSPDS